MKGDAAVIDQDGQQYMYRFKKKVNNNQGPLIYKRIKSSPYFIAYLILGSLVVVLIAIIVFLFVRKNFRREERGEDE